MGLGLCLPAFLFECVGSGGLLGVEEVYAVGGAQAIAMFAYGVPGLCAADDMVTGPGNIYVTAAKRLLKGRIGIDSEAGPTEIAVIADDTANPAFVAAYGDIVASKASSSAKGVDGAQMAMRVIGHSLPRQPPP